MTRGEAEEDGGGGGEGKIGKKGFCSVFGGAVEKGYLGGVGGLLGCGANAGGCIGGGVAVSGKKGWWRSRRWWW